MLTLLLFYGVRHQLFLGALGADDVLAVRDEALADHAALAGGADEAVVVPVTALEGNEPGAADTCDGFAASCASLAEQFSEAVGTVRFVIATRESLTCQRLLAMSAGETLSVPRIIPVGHASLSDHLAAFDAFGRKFFLVAFSTVNIVLLGDETLGADGVLAGAAHEALLVPLPCLVLHLLHAGLEHVTASIAPGGELGIVARAAVDTVGLGAELLVHQGGSALAALEAGLVPVLLLVGQILAVNANHLAALVAVVGKDILVTFDTERMVVSQNVSVTSQTVITMMTK